MNIPLHASKTEQSKIKNLLFDSIESGTKKEIIILKEKESLLLAEELEKELIKILRDKQKY